MNIIAIHLEPGPVGWLRCWNWTTALGRRGHNVKHRPHASTQFEWSEIDNYVKDADVVIAGRMPHAQVFAALLAGRDLYKYKLVVDCDDNFDQTPMYNQSFTDYHSASGAARLARAQLRSADMVTVSTEPLKEWAEQYSPRVVVMPNCVDTSLYANVRSREKEARHKGDIRIYWGGGAGHYEDLLKVRDPLLRIFAERPNVKLIFSNILPDWAVDLPAMRVFFIRFVHMNAYAKILRWLCADVALAPLVDNEFNRCKSNIKYLDYGMAGIPGVYSDIEPYKDVIGLKARTETDWYESINRLLDDQALRKDIAWRAKADILENWTIDKHIGRYEQMLQEVLEKKPVPEFTMLEEGVPCQIQS